MELKGILGISHTESESGSGKSMLTTVEQGPSKVERINMSSYDEKSSYGSNQSVPQTSSGYESRGAINGYASSRASDWYSNRMKVLCSFGGKVLLRPSDRKLRYVGGETRIMCIARDISFQQLKQKVLAIYSEAHAIKYQLPGEDLDALVSVSCHEDLLNMMEEWSEVEDRESSHKLRLFLFSMRDLDDAQFGLGSIEGDSEMQYVVAVNGLDMGSRRSLTTHDLANSSGTNLAELDRSSIDREMSQVDTGAVGIGTSHLIGTVHSFQPIVQSSPSAHEIYPQFCQRQMMDHRATKQRYLHCCYSTSNYSPLYSTSICRFMNQEGWMNEGQPHDGFQVQNSYLFVKELKLTYDASVQQTVDAEKTHPSGKVYPVPVDEALGAVSMPGGGFQVQNLHTLKEVKATPGPSIQQAIDAEKICPLENIYMDPVDEISDAVSMPVGNAHSLPPKTGGKCQQPIKVSSSSDATNVVHVPKFCEDDQCSASSSTFGPGHTDAIPNPIDLSYLEPSLPSQRVYFSERIPREQAELLNRLSKSDDTLGSQFLISLADIAEGSRHAESVEKLPGGNLVAHTEPSVSAGKPFYAVTHTVDDGLPQLQKNKKFTDLASHTNTQFSDSEAVLECGSKPAVPSDGDTEDCEKGGRLLNADCEIDNSTANLEKVFGDGTREAGSRHSTAANVTSVMHHRDPASDDSQCADIADNDMSRDINLGQLEPPKKNGDIQIDIYDGFPCDLLSEIFSKGIFTDGPSGISLAHREGAGVNVNMENCERRHWSYFQKLAQEEFVQKDVSLLDQGHLGTPSAFMKADSEHTISYQHMPSATDRFSMGHEYSQLKFDENNLNKLSGISRVESTMVPDFDQAKIKESESMQFNAMIENLKSPESQYEDGNLENTNVGLPPFDPSLVDFDVNTLQIIKNEDLGELRELGSGTFGTVYHGKWRGTDVAIQRLKKICFAGCSSEQERLTLEFWREAEILSTLHHPNVMAFYGVVQNAPGGTLATVTEYMVDGSLRHVLLQKDRCLDHCRRLLIAMDAAFGMEYLHSKNIVHFDLKCDNLLINLKDPQRPICKVGDFGLSKIKRNTLVSGGVWGTLPWMAPELLNGSSDKVSEKVDVFSFGIVLWEILTGEEPYANMHYGTIIGGIVDNTLRPIIPTFCDPEWRRLMEQCWAPNPSFRPSFTEIVNRLHIMSTVAGQSKGHSNNASK